MPEERIYIRVEDVLPSTEDVDMDAIEGLMAEPCLLDTHPHPLP